MEREKSGKMVTGVGYFEKEDKYDEKNMSMEM